MRNVDTYGLNRIGFLRLYETLVDWLQMFVDTQGLELQSPLPRRLPVPLPMVSASHILPLFLVPKATSASTHYRLPLTKTIFGTSMTTIHT
jgi:hypothetical protein